jgi:4-alpha-glucanotransferase
MKAGVSSIPSWMHRSGGVLLHPTSLPGPYGIGDLGPAVDGWIAWMASAGCRLWQVLPLGPTGYGDSPYQSLSAFAGNPLLISPERLADDGLLRPKDLEDLPAMPDDRVDFGAVISVRDRLLRTAFDRYRSGEGSQLRDGFEAFRRDKGDWLDDFALFMALKREHGGAPWTEWDHSLSARQPEALERAHEALADAIEEQRFRQFLFFRQWSAVRAEAQRQAITLIGDIPIFVAHDSADVWSHPELFWLDESGRPSVVAGVPPDYFSPTGQLWGNPLYRWEALQSSGYEWWIRRFRLVLEMVDIVRLDHFRGFEAYWEVPGDAPTAETGRWVPGPGAAFLDATQAALGSLPILAEDLGVITPGVVALRERYALPGMKILQFAFEGEPEHDFLPHNYPDRCVVYTGTHDNDTALGWYQSAGEEERDFCRRYLASDGAQIAWDMIRACWASVAQWAVVPLQDILNLGAEARMNYPSRAEGNWWWRFQEGQLSDELAARWKALSFLYGRLPADEVPADRLED